MLPGILAACVPEHWPHVVIVVVVVVVCVCVFGGGDMPFDGLGPFAALHQPPGSGHTNKKTSRGTALGVGKGNGWMWGWGRV